MFVDYLLAVGSVVAVIIQAVVLVRQPVDSAAGLFLVGSSLAGSFLECSEILKHLFIELLKIK